MDRVISEKSQMRLRSRINLEAFLDGVTGAGLFVDPVEHSAGEIAVAASLLQEPLVATRSGSSPHESRVTVTSQRS
jgi:hypothetical protein